MNNKILTTLLLSMLLLPAMAQGHGDAVYADSTEIQRPATMALSLRIGQGQVRDTYLTPLLYSGASYGIEAQRWRMQRNHLWVNWQQADLAFSTCTDKGEHGDTWAGRLRYQYASLRRWRLSQLVNGLSLYAGPYASLDVGFDYNLKMASSNNPATMRLVTNTGLMAAVGYAPTVCDQRLPLLLQARTPLLGFGFMPEYGASYYETFYLSNTENNAHFTSLHNQQDLDLQFTADVPVALIPGLHRLDAVIRVGASYHIETMHINDIRTRYSSIEFVLGWVYQYLPFGRNKSQCLKRSVYEAY